jgi:ABC-type sulfate transport system permease subunit
MEQQKLPNSTMIIVLSIFGYICCCIPIIGIIPASIAFSMATKSQKIYEVNPELYDNMSAIKTGKIVALIAIILNLLMFVRWIYIFATGDINEAYDEFMKAFNEAMEAQGQ